MGGAPRRSGPDHGPAHRDEGAAKTLALPIPYAPRNEPWGVRRFFVADPEGRLVNIVDHR